MKTILDKVKQKKKAKKTKVSLATAKSESYYKYFDFFYNRSCFRIMTEFYKVKFNKFYYKRLVTLKK